MMEISDFIKGVTARAKAACDYGKKEAMDHYAYVSGGSQDEAEAFYLAVRVAVADCVVGMRCKVEEVGGVVASRRLGCLTPAGDAKRKMAEKLMGCDDFGTIYADCRNSQDSATGECMFVLSSAGEAVCFNGDLVRLTNSEREDYASDPSLLLYPMENMADCKTAALIKGITRRDAVMGGEKLLDMIVDRTYDVGHAQVMMFSEPKLEYVESIVVTSREDVSAVRRKISELKFLVPVRLSSAEYVAHFPKVGTDMHLEKDDKLGNPRGMRTLYMRSGDRVALKPLPTQPRKMGRVVDSDGISVTVHWDDDTRSMYDSAEALMRLMPAPTSDLVRPLVPGHGMDEESARVLAMNGIDPDTLWSMLSYMRPASDSSAGWKDRVADGLSRFGLEAKEVKGFKPEGPAFEPAEWIEAGLWSGDRLVIEVDASSVHVEAGDADDHVVPTDVPMAQIE